MSNQPLKKRVGFNLLWLVPNDVGGSEEATVNALDALGASDGSNFEIVIFATPQTVETYPNLADRFETEVIDIDNSSRVRRILTENRKDSPFDGHGLDLVHHGGGTIPRRGSTPTTVTIHDLQPLDLAENFSRQKRYYLRSGIAHAATKASAIGVPSSFVRRGVSERYGRNESTFVVPWCLGPTNRSTSENTGRKFGLDRPYFIYPAVTWPHKNHEVLIDAMKSVSASADCDLVFTGSPGPHQETVDALISKSGARNSIKSLGRIPREDLMGLIEDSLALVFPSKYEGFGMPVLEAMSQGVPVISSNAGSLQEIGGIGAEYLDPSDVEGWASAMINVATAPEIRENMGSLAFEASKEFGPSLTAAGYHQLWQSGLSN